MIPTVSMAPPVPTQMVVAPIQPIAPPVSNTPIPATALSATLLVATAPNYGGLLWVIGLVLIVGGAVLVLMRTRVHKG